MNRQKFLANLRGVLVLVSVSVSVSVVVVVVAAYAVSSRTLLRIELL